MPSFKNTNPPMDRATFRANLAAIPRVKIAHLPTPLEELHRLTAELGGPRILIKRDDATGLAMGGNDGCDAQGGRVLLGLGWEVHLDTLVELGIVRREGVEQR